MRLVTETLLEVDIQKIFTKTFERGRFRIHGLSIFLTPHFLTDIKKWKKRSLTAKNTVSKSVPLSSDLFAPNTALECDLPELIRLNLSFPLEVNHFTSQDLLSAPAGNTRKT